MTDLRQYIVETPDFPRPGILFRDISPLLRHHFDATLAALESLLTPQEWRNVDVIGGVDARGFMLGAGLAARRGLGFVPIRKQGKLPPPVLAAGYSLEYGHAAVEMHAGQGRMLLVDDVLATGGTLGAAAGLCTQAGYELRAIAVLADLGLAGGAPVQGMPVRSLWCYRS